MTEQNSVGIYFTPPLNGNSITIQAIAEYGKNISGVKKVLLSVEIDVINTAYIPFLQAVPNKYVEMAFRAYDPCFSCATHSQPGKMPLILNIQNMNGEILQTIKKN